MLLARTGVFFTVAALLWWLAGSRLVFINDEGIYLEGARRMFLGAAPYRDFFALTGPGVYWNLYLVFHLFGVSLPSARLLLICDVSLIAACLYWLGAMFQSRLLGVWLAWFYVAVLSADTSALLVNHRWDSAALIVLAVVLLVRASRSGRSPQPGQSCWRCRS